MKIKTAVGITALLFASFGWSLLGFTNWRIAIAVFFIIWSNNLNNKLK